VWLGGSQDDQPGEARVGQLRLRSDLPGKGSQAHKELTPEPGAGRIGDGQQAKNVCHQCLFRSMATGARTADSHP
jgi:hypothetical protein